LTTKTYIRKFTAYQYEMAVGLTVNSCGTFVQVKWYEFKIKHTMATSI